MPRRRRQTPVRSRAVPPAEPARVRVRTPSAGVTRIRTAPAAPVASAPSPEQRDTRPFRERVTSRQGHIGLLLFRIGQETFAAELGAVDEAVEVPALHGLPEMRSGMLGMFDLRGRMLPVFSAAIPLGVEITSHSGATLVMRANDRRVGIAVEDVDDVIEADCASLRGVPGSADPDGVFLAVLQQGTRIASVIDAAALVDACLALAPEGR